MRIALALISAFIATTASAESQVVHVRSFGEDSPTCGAQLTPCRSINYGVQRADIGDTVLVGPGLYGDLNRNGVTGETGEEGPPRPVDGCLVCIGKRITVLSERGAAHTTIDARNLPLTAVSMTMYGGANAVFGYAEQGFTVLAGEGKGIELSMFGVAWGNRVVGGTVGIDSPFGGAGIYDNEVSDAAEVGIHMYTGWVSGNVVARTGTGINAGRAAVTANALLDNRGPGVVIGDPFHGPPGSIFRNIFIRNQGPGLLLHHGDPAEAQAVVVDSNDFIGNDLEHGCGLQNNTGGGLPVWAANNFWAAAPDFGVTEQIACNGAGSTTIVEPARLQPH